jgi:prolyl-tRNA synthetase
MERDIPDAEYVDVAKITEGGICPKCGKPMIKISRGIEVGNIFQLGTKYTKSMNMTYLDADGQTQTPIMGCYGIGVGRTMAAAVEQNNDKDGIIWPVEIAPYHVIVVPINIKDESVKEKAFSVYNELKKAGIEVILDDRDERPGVKFKDADLIGYPVRVVLGKKALDNGQIEVKVRKTGEMKMLPADDFIDGIKSILAELKK